MENQGWIKLHRKLLESSFASKPTTLSLFIHLLLMANHEDNSFLFNQEEITIKKGQLLTGLLQLSKKAGLTIMQTRYALSSLKVTNTLTIKTTNKFSIITILNYEQYQDINKQNNKPVTNQQQTSNKPVTTNNNDKNDKNDKNINTMASPETKNISSIGDIIQKRSGISTEWQDKAFRVAHALKIEFRDPSLKSRWLKFFKTGNSIRIDRAYSYLSDYPPFNQLPTCEAKVKYFFWYYANK